VNEELKQGDNIEIRLIPTEVENVSKEVEYISIPFELATNIYRLCLEVQVINWGEILIDERCKTPEPSRDFLPVNITLMKTLAREYLLYATNNTRIKGRES